MNMKTILVADDEPLVRKLVRTILGRAGRYEVLLARDGSECLELALEHRPDLVYLDVSMPRRNGYEVCRELRANPATARTRIVLLTAMVQDEDRRRGLEAGADDYLTKPFSPAFLASKTREYLEAG